MGSGSATQPYYEERSYGDGSGTVRTVRLRAPFCNRLHTYTGMYKGTFE